MVEQEAVNFEVTGSSPVRGATNKNEALASIFILFTREASYRIGKSVRSALVAKPSKGRLTPGPGSQLFKLKS